jgi:hypothetical protein
MAARGFVMAMKAADPTYFMGAAVHFRMEPGFGLE